ncbi:MAG: suppressor of fused domain protein [Eubacterium sp.]|nr:suppressor of fused domain protein [Eubacterium sp.]
MGLFDKYKKKKVDAPKATEIQDAKTDQEADEEKTIGWDAITEAFEKAYPEQTNPKHYGTLIKSRFGGNDPLDGISVYDGGDYWHFVTYGLSEIYDKETDDPAVSGYGMEFTLKLKKGSYDNEEDEIRCICGILQSIARITFQSGELFKEYEYIYSGQTTGMDSRQKSKLTGFITVSDTKVAGIDTPNGRVNFVELIGVTNEELLSIINKEQTVRGLYAFLGSDLTDYDRN